MKVLSSKVIIICERDRQKQFLSSSCWVESLWHLQVVKCDHLLSFTYDRYSVERSARRKCSLSKRKTEPIVCENVCHSQSHELLTT